MWSGLFHLHNTTSSSMSGPPLFLRLNNNPLYLYHIYTIYMYLSIHLSIDTEIVSNILPAEGGAEHGTSVISLS